MLHSTHTHTLQSRTCMCTTTDTTMSSCVATHVCLSEAVYINKQIAENVAHSYIYPSTHHTSLKLIKSHRFAGNYCSRQAIITFLSTCLLITRLQQSFRSAAVTNSVRTSPSYATSDLPQLQLVDTRCERTVITQHEEP